MDQTIFPENMIILNAKPHFNFVFTSHQNYQTSKVSIYVIQEIDYESVFLKMYLPTKLLLHNIITHMQFVLKFK